MCLKFFNYYEIREIFKVIRRDFSLKTELLWESFKFNRTILEVQITITDKLSRKNIVIAIFLNHFAQNILG